VTALDRIPLRARMTVAFVLTTGLVLGGLSLFLHQRLADELDTSLRSGLRSRVGDLAGQIRRTGRPDLPVNAVVDRDDDLAQILSRSGVVEATASGRRRTPLLSGEQARRAARRLVVVDRASVPDDDDDVLLVAAPAGRYVAVVGTDLRDRDRALANLDGLLGIGVPAALLLAGAAGFLVAGGGLRPVERMRRRAESIGTGDLSERLPVPASRDEVGRLAQTLNAMLARLQHGFERERTFVADASHELRTPIARLKAELELADSDRRSATELRAAVRSSRAEADLLARLADDLLVLARADQGRLPVRPEPVRLAAFLRDLVARFELDPDIVDCPDDLVVEADPTRLHQAVGNLLDNAHRHASEAVAVRAHGHNAFIRIHVLDDGPGVPEDLRAVAFERFTRADAAREGSGAGLGLSIVAAVASAHGGEVGISDAPGGGADIWLSVPASDRA
jgi:two-component system OmpR family sensor kinase